MATNLLIRKIKGSRQEPSAPAPEFRPQGAHTYQPVHEWPNPAKPSALMVPKYIRENYAVAKTRKKVLAGLAAAAVVSACLVGGSFYLSHSAKSSLEDVQAQQAAAKAEVDRLSPVAAYYDGLEVRRAATVAALGTDLSHAELLGKIIQSLPTGAAITSYATAMDAPCQSPDPFVVPTTTALGCITFVGTAKTESDVALIVAALSDVVRTEGMLVDPFLSTLDVGDNARFTINVNFTTEAYSGKYTETPADPSATDTAAPAADSTTDPNADPATDPTGTETPTAPTTPTSTETTQ